MPETTVDENYGRVLWQHNIRLTWQSINMDPESVAQSVKQAPHPLLDTGILSSDVRHNLASLFGIERVHPRFDLAYATDWSIRASVTPSVVRLQKAFRRTSLLATRARAERRFRFASRSQSCCRKT